MTITAPQIPDSRIKTSDLITMYREQFAKAQDDLDYRAVPAYMRNPEDWGYGVRHLNQFQRMWYVNLVDEAWVHSKASGPQGTLPNDRERLWQLAQVEDLLSNVNQTLTKRTTFGSPPFSEDAEETHYQTQLRELCQNWFDEVLQNFVELPSFPSLLHNKRLSIELYKAVQKSKARKNASDKALEARERIKEEKDKDNEIKDLAPNVDQTITKRSSNVDQTLTKDNHLVDQSSTFGSLIANSNSNRKDLGTGETKISTSGRDRVGSEKAEKPKRDLGLEAREVFEFWQSVMGRKSQAVFKGVRENKIRARLQTYTAEELKRAVRGCAASDYHMGREEGQPKKHNDIELICRDAKHVEMFLEFLEVNPNGHKEKRDPYREFQQSLELEVDEAAEGFDGPVAEADDYELPALDT